MLNQLSFRYSYKQTHNNKKQIQSKYNGHSNSKIEVQRMASKQRGPV